MDKEESSDIANKETPQQVDQAKSATDKSGDQMKSKKMHDKKKMHKETNDNSMNNNLFVIPLSKILPVVYALMRREVVDWINPHAMSQNG